jgi:hypothetical protein
MSSTNNKVTIEELQAQQQAEQEAEDRQCAEENTVASKTAPMFACSSKIQILCFNEWINF